ncbi:MAG: hypothetical protein Tsb0014_22400 [Pleurocapsa sp.]
MAKFHKIKKFYPTLILSVLLSLAAPQKAQAQVYINGYLYQGQELAELEYYLGTIPPGRYWLDVDTGYWGYEGDSTIQGNVLQQQNNDTYSTDNSYVRSNGDIYDPSYGGSSATTDSNGCTYFSIPGMTVNSCDDNW